MFDWTIQTRRRAVQRWLVALAVVWSGLMMPGAVSPAVADGGESDDAKVALNPETLWELARLGGADLAPDGSWAVLPVTRYERESGDAKTDLWRVSTEDGTARRLTTNAARDNSPKVSPDGRWIAFQAKRDGDDAPQLYLLPTDGGEAERITEIPTGVDSYKWFGDSTRLLLSSRVWPELSWEEAKEKLKERKDSKVSAQTWEIVPIRWWDHWIDEREAHLYVVSREGGEPAAVTLGTGYQLSRAGTDESSYDVSPDGAEIAFSADSKNDGVDPDYDIFVIPTAGGEAKNITTDNSGQDDGPLYSPDGKWLAFGRQVINGFYADRVRLVLHDRGEGGNRVIHDDWDRSLAPQAWAPDSTALYGTVDDAGNNRAYRIPADGSAPVALTEGTSFSSLAVARDGGEKPTLVALQQSFVQPPTLVRLDGDGEVTKLSTFNDEVLATVDFGTYESVTYTGAAGDEIQMWVNYPPGFDKEAGKAWPLYLLIHGGPHNGITDSFHFRWNAQLFSSWGYVTAWPNFHGSSGFGQDFADSINPNRSDMPYEDVLKATDWLASKSWIDADRMAAGGGSYGGYLTSVILGREHPYQALIAHAAVYNSFTQYGADYGAGKRRHGEHWENPENYRLYSPHTGAGNFETPTLVIHGQKDYRVPVNHGIELFNTLQNRGVESRLVYYPDENHWILKRHNSIHWYGECRDWLHRFLAAEESEAE
ncbi:MAG: S9 family peptidase [Acidobacteriota bacterium]